jgi:hypothetical protein
MNLTLPAALLGDYFIYRTGTAGKLPPGFLPDWAVRGWRTVMLIGSMLFLPAVGIVSTCFLLRWHVHALMAVLLAVALTLALYLAVRHFNRSWAHVDTYDVGSARRLVGRCAVFQVFVGVGWRRYKREECRRALRSACDWLQSKATEHGLSLELVTEPPDVYLLEDLPITEAMQSPDRWRPYRRELHTVRQQIEILGPRLTSAVRARVERLPQRPDHVCLIVQTSARHGAFATPAHNDLEAECALELCVCGWETDAIVYAHELLHLFGAPDLYLSPWRILSQRAEANADLQRLEQQFAWSAFEIFSAYFRRSIMGGTAPDLKYLTIDPITARAIGWRPADKEYMKAAVQVEQALGEVVVDIIEKP